MAAVFQTVLYACGKWEVGPGILTLNWGTADDFVENSLICKFL